MLNQGQHSFSTVVRDVGTACTEDSTPMLDKPACRFIRVENRHVLSIRKAEKKNLAPIPTAERYTLFWQAVKAISRFTFGGEQLFKLIKSDSPIQLTWHQLHKR